MGTILYIVPWFLAGSSIASFGMEDYKVGGITLAVAVMWGRIADSLEWR
jgi:hypothetical protein